VKTHISLSWEGKLYIATLRRNLPGQDNEAIWSQWVPVDTNCQEGFGMVDASDSRPKDDRFIKKKVVKKLDVNKKPEFSW
jgi:hypothetical protein